MPCITCHSHVPKLNAFGEQFLSNGYRIPGRSKAPTVPASVWASGLTQNYPNDAERFKSIFNRVELISAGESDNGRISYFAEWRVVSLEFLSDMSVRDRSGRFEDLFATFALGDDLKLQIGQYRALSQIDVSRRLNLAEPIVFSTALPGESHPDPRIQSLRGFSLSGRSPSLRVSAERQGWTYAAIVPFPGEFSIPLLDEAKTTASFEFEPDPKGVLLEAFFRDGVNSIGIHSFFGRNERKLVGVAGQGRWKNLWFEGGIARAEFAGGSEWRYSIGFDWIPSDEIAAGMRVDQRQIAGQKAMFLPYISWQRPFGDQSAKVVFEGRLQNGRTPRWLMEIGWMF